MFFSIKEAGTDEPPFETPDLAYAFDEGYTTLHVYPPHGKAFAETTPEGLYGVADGDAVQAYTGDILPLMAAALQTNVAGRIEAGGEWQTWADPTLAGEVARGPTMLLDGKWAHVVSSVLEGLETPPVVDPSSTMCFEHRVRFHDEGRQVNGQLEHYRSSSSGTFPARYLWVTILREDGGTLVPTPEFNGPLDQYGCASLPALPAGRYTAWTFERVQKDDTIAKVYDYVRRLDQRSWCFSLDGGALRCPDEYPVGAALAFTVPAQGQLPPSLTVALSDIVADAGNVAATYGQIFFSPDNGVTTGQTYLAFAAERCPSIDNGRRLEACYSPDGQTLTDEFGQPVVYPGRAVYLGSNYSDPGLSGDLSTATSNAEHKYVAAHEIGHQFQDRLYGGWNYSYDRRAGLNISGLCGCSGLNPSGNEIHCLQSSERQGAGQTEGYAQAFASNVWNARDDAECVFTYYKNFRRPDGGIDVAPSAKSCTAQVRWAETYCPVASRATEYDWMGFYTGISRATTGAIPQTDLKRVYARTCSGSPTGTCTYTNTTPWSGLDAAAQAEFGALSPSYQTFVSNGSAYGVTR